jgi:hypothetical protein
VEGSIVHLEAGNKSSRPLDEEVYLNNQVPIQQTGRQMVLNKLIGSIPQHLIYSYFINFFLLPI